MKKRLCSLFTLLFFMFSTTAFAYQNNSYDKDLKIGLQNMVSNEINITLNGNYTGDNQAFPNGTSFVLKVNNGKIDFNGKQYDEITFVPEKVDSTIKLQAGAKKYNYYGTMTFKMSSGNIFPINTVNIERYLKGVVAYEMSNSFPLEALKAQAVAARNYALSNVNRHRNEGYDLCDGVHCQVYRGYNSSYINVEKAVDETKGMVLLHDEKLVYAYYSASNGGYTEASGNIWSQQLPYLISKPDELENENWPYGDMSFGTLDIDKALKDRGYLTLTDMFVRIDIENIKRNESGRVSSIDIVYNDINGVENRRTFTKEGPRIFLSLPSSFYNVVYDVTTDRYTFSGKGYGHGVGMSQNGAKYRAKAGQTYEQILSFYYDGAYLQKIEPSIVTAPVSNDIPSGEVVFTPPSISNFRLAPITVYEGRPVALQVYTSDGSGKGIQYKYEVLGDNSVIDSKGYQDNFRFEFTPLKYGNYKARVYIRDKVSTKDYDDFMELNFEVLKNSEPSRGDSSTPSELLPIKQGMKGSNVADLQRMLTNLGFSIGVIDGQFGGKTYTAVSSFQKSKGLSVTGIVDRITLDEMNKAILEKNQIPDKPSAPTTPPVTAPVSNALQFTRTLKAGIQGNDVKQLQNALISLGYKTLSANGVFESKTSNAVKDFQKKSGLAADGIAGKATFNAINIKVAAAIKQPSTSTPSRGENATQVKLEIPSGIKKGMKGEGVKKLQEALNKLSYNVGTADGVFGSKTEIALKSFQSSNGLKVTGITDADTIKTLSEKLR